MGWVLRYGNGYAEIERDNRGAPYALWPIHPDRVEPARRNGHGELFYRVWDEAGGGYVDLAAMDMFHIRGFGDGAVGLSVIEYAAESIGWAQATEIFGATFFGEGMNPSGIVDVQKGLSAGGRRRPARGAGGLYKGPKGKRTAILDAGMKFERLATNPNDAQFIETRSTRSRRSAAGSACRRTRSCTCCARPSRTSSTSRSRWWSTASRRGSRSSRTRPTTSCSAPEPPSGSSPR
jgi:HK97 family phage portal protein